MWSLQAIYCVTVFSIDSKLLHMAKHISLSLLTIYILVISEFHITKIVFVVQRYLCNIKNNQTFPVVDCQLQKAMCKFNGPIRIASAL